MKAVGRLLRLSLFPSALADVVAGVVLGAGFWPGGLGPWLLAAASLCVYHGGMALNDWADRERDQLERPDRPIPSGRVPAGAAAMLGFALLVAGPWIALGTGREPAFVLAAVAVLAASYDLFARGPILGPLMLGLCRAGNLAAGLALGRLAAARAWPAEEALQAYAPADLAVPVLYGVYVCVVALLGRLEDGEDERLLERRPGVLIAAAAGLLLVLPIVPVPALPVLPSGAWLPRGELAAVLPEGPGLLQRHRITLAMIPCALGAFGLLRLAFRRTAWTKGRVLRAMGMALRRLLVFTSAAAVLRGTPAGLFAGLAILAGYPISFLLRKAFPPS